MTAECPEYGYPVPGVQNVPGTEVMKSVFFMSDEDWETARVSGSFDFVIIGSSFCALAFVDRVLRNNPQAKCLILERGHYFHPEHFQNLPPAYMRTLTGGVAETFPWKITEETHNGEYIKWQHGMNNYFGGRSFFWSGWCPEPTDEEMEDWPEQLKATIHSYYPEAIKLLNIIPANEIFDKERSCKPIFGLLQDKMDQMLANTPSEVDTVTRVFPAPLAVSAEKYRYIDYQKFSAQGALLALAAVSQFIAEDGQPPALQFVVDCLVEKIKHNGLQATELETSKGTFNLGNAKLILAMGTLPPTTLVLNSFPASEFPLLHKVGERFTSHFISSIIARFPREDLPNHDQLGDMEMAAVYVAGVNRDSNHQFHIQLSAVADTKPIQNIFDTLRHLPDVVASPSIPQLRTSKSHVVLVCACLGQLDHNNDASWFRKNDGEDITTNVTLQVVANDVDNALWDTMDSSTFDTLEKVISSPDRLEYWHIATNDGETDGWRSERPPAAQIRVPGLVHEASTMWIGDDTNPDAPVGLDYKLKGVDNVYVTGASLWPTGASWNPTGVMAAMGIHLADRLWPKNAKPADSN